VARTLTLRLNEAQYEALRSKAADLNLTPTQVILDALESYGALPPDEGSISSSGLISEISSDSPRQRGLRLSY